MVGDPEITVWCDRCGHEDQFGLTSLARNGWDDRNLKPQLIACGWVLADGLDGETYCCEECANESEATP